MYYVAKVFKGTTPLIVETFALLTDANDYVNIMTRTNKGTYIILEEVSQ